MTEDHRVAPRQRVLKGGRIVINDGFSTFQCTVRNLSATGARLKVAGVVGIPDAFELLMDDGRRFACIAKWKTEFEIGVEFDPTA
ncbi:PilZ domain-containing protein [Devosia sp.]|uniref:PilZ domain-containing protein n=1 Tax=Devosia sp. TaxID=1871048 RepID=UPI0019E66A22|nr:PilZ domain-containing protein [Devosia sp.]MBE0578148.1 PilZ domain-containing protein [Devosia sp.]